MIKCITLLRDEADGIGALVDRTGREPPLRLALCRVRNPARSLRSSCRGMPIWQTCTTHVAQGETIIVEERVARGADWLAGRWSCETR